MSSSIPHVIIKLCFVSTIISISISLVCIFMHFMNYRKPLQQRLIVRILLIIPIYSSISYLNLVSSHLISGFLEPIKEIYEAFVLYIFYSLLTDLLGGERNIIVTASGRAPVKQPFPMNILGSPVDISDPETFLLIKRSILQYVWLKPVLCLLFAVNEIIKGNEGNKAQHKSFLISFGFWVNLIYNVSVSLSLYNLALFWKCLYLDLKKFNPWGKFLCVKLIIFASYWQGIILSILNYFNCLKESSFEIQNSLLCFELIGFAIGHWHSFNFREFTVRYLPYSARLSLRYALIDVFGYADLIYDFKITFQLGEERYNFKKFQSVDIDSKVSQHDTRTRMKKLNQGLRYYNLENGKKGTYWLNPKNTSNEGRRGLVGMNSDDDEETLYSFNGDSPTLPAEATIAADNSNPGNRTAKKQKYQRPEPQASSSKTKSNHSGKAGQFSKITNKIKSQLAHEKKVAAIKKNTKEVYKLDKFSTEKLLNDISLTKEDFLEDNKLYIKAIRKKPFGDDNYPVIFDEIGYIYSTGMKKRRLEALNKQRKASFQETRRSMLGKDNILENGRGYGSINDQERDDSEVVNGLYRV